MRNDEINKQVVDEGEKVVVFVVKGAVKEADKLLKTALEGMDKYLHGDSSKRGEMRAKDLTAKNTDKSLLKVDGKIEGFDKIAKKYGLDYSLIYNQKDNETMLMYQAKDSESLSSAFNDFTKENLEPKQSIFERISKIEKSQNQDVAMEDFVQTLEQGAQKGLEQGAGTAGGAVTAGATQVVKAVKEVTKVVSSTLDRGER